MSRHGKTTDGGFTIVELLIVIVVIGILAAIVVVAYNGVQAKAKDVRIKDAASEIEKALRAWSIDRGLPTGAGYGSTANSGDGVCTGSLGGFAGKGVYVCTLEDMLVDSKLLPAKYITSLPVNKIYGGSTSGNLTIMFYQSGSQFCLFYYLENPTASDTTDVNNASTICGSGPRDSWGMRGAKVLTF